MFDDGNQGTNYAVGLHSTDVPMKNREMKEVIRRLFLEEGEVLEEEQDNEDCRLILDQLTR